MFVWVFTGPQAARSSHLGPLLVAPDLAAAPPLPQFQECLVGEPLSPGPALRVTPPEPRAIQIYFRGRGEMPGCGRRAGGQEGRRAVAGQHRHDVNNQEECSYA
eukprot:768259-Hanusia_phi.AAC.10